MPKAEKSPLEKNKPKAASVKTVSVVKRPVQPVHTCRRQNRSTCPVQISRPEYVIRWYRMPDEYFCRAYHYTYCNQDIEQKDGVIDSEEACQELCFSKEEMIILPQFRIL
uniref:BPTI/Kunitz inhibitor domain-containing protein n=1 Tax=Acrobeloides nanus TaxID=290746 RepID=A0A914EDH3_9BILA